MPYIPQFNKLSMSEMAYAPTLMRQQHDDAVAKQMELAEAMKFDYLQQDANILEPVLQKYNDEISKVSTDLAKSGFTHDTKNKILGLRSQFTGDDKIRHIKKQYADAMEGWGEQKKALIQKGASGDLLNKQKAAYFGNYKGGFDDEGYKQDFTPGRTSGVYDITEDAKKAMTNIGKTGQIVGSSGSNVQLINDPKLGSYYKIYDSTTGQYITTKNQIEATKAYLKAEYNPENPTSDRGLYSKIAGYSTDYIGSLVDQVGSSMIDGYYQSLPQNRIDFAGLGSDNKKPPAPAMPLPEYDIPELRPKEYDEAAEDLKVLSGEKPKPKSVPIGTIQFPGTFSGQQVTKGKTQTTEEATRDIVAKLEPKYPGLFKSGMSKVDAAKVASMYEMNYAATSKSMLALKSPDIVENLYNSLAAAGEKPMLERVTSDGKKGVKTFADVVKTYEGTGLDWKQVPPMVNPYGETFIRDAGGNYYKVNESSFDKTTQKLKKDVVKPTMDQLLDPRLFDKPDVKPIEVAGARTAFPNGLYLNVNLIDHPNADPYNIEHRVVEFVTPSGNVDENGEPLYYKVKTITPGDTFQELTEGQRTGFQTYIK